MESVNRSKLTEVEAIKLHHRVAQGQSVSEEERRMLDQWYIEQDALESASFQSPSNDLLLEMKAQLADILASLTISTQKLQMISAENERLRLQNKRLETLLFEQLQPV